MFREWDARTAPDAEVEALLAMLNAALAADQPGDPLWRNDRFRECITELVPGQRRQAWTAHDGDGRLCGHVNMLLMGDTGVVELLVHPADRRRGLGRRLLGRAVRWAHAQGYTSVGVEVPGDTPGVAFYGGLGFRQAYAEVRSVLDLGSVDWLALGEMARGIGSGYRLAYHRGGPPAELLASYTLAKAEMRNAGGDGDLELRPGSYDPQRLTESLACLERRGMSPHVIVAVHERSDEVAGLTEVVVPAQRPSRADQYDTVVVPDHRGYGIDRAMKARMLFELRAAAPRVREVQTWNDPQDRHLININADMGFRTDRPWLEYEAEVPALVARLAR
ncbi:GNAT family N-acetyltransferase [Pilimelia terevasa]|uniref:GNAT family N-acetyltransferase n=1 Tax=Pilimelia terevasa TaxID=53372 RepID=UPI00166CC720|nr:GNAT family N-acetyltransferase [Pilimelia terevasa]